MFGGGKIGHASLEVFSEKGHEYLSFWPFGHYTGDTVPRNSILNDFATDCNAERRNNSGPPRQPEGIYQLPISKEQANNIYDSIQDIRKKVDNKELKYTLYNQANSEEGKPNENYNCSGMIQNVLTKNLALDFGDPKYSHPLVLASKMVETSGIIVKSHNEKALGFELPERLNEPTNIEIARPRM